MSDFNLFSKKENNNDSLSNKIEELKKQSKDKKDCCNFTPCIIPPGPTGPTGVTGPTGPQGLQGIPGEAGPTPTYL